MRHAKVCDFEFCINVCSICIPVIRRWQLLHSVTHQNQPLILRRFRCFHKPVSLKVKCYFIFKL